MTVRLPKLAVTQSPTKLHSISVKKDFVLNFYKRGKMFASRRKRVLQNAKPRQLILTLIQYIKFFVNSDMQSAKATVNYRYAEFDLKLTIFGQRKFSLTVVDFATRVEYFEKEIILESIGVNTFIKALEQSKQEIKVYFFRKTEAQNELLQIKVTVESPFFKPVQEVFFCKKIREVSEEETLKRSLEHLSKKIKDLKENDEKNNLVTYCGATLQTISYNGDSYDPLASIKLPKGKYLLTFNFMARCQSQWIYLYFGQGQLLMQNFSGFYVPTTTHFIPHTIRKIHTVTNEFENVQFTTYCANSYPITIRNAVITAKPISE